MDFCKKNWKAFHSNTCYLLQQINLVQFFLISGSRGSITPGPPITPLVFTNARGEKNRDNVPDQRRCVVTECCSHTVWGNKSVCNLVWRRAYFTPFTRQWTLLDESRKRKMIFHSVPTKMTLLLFIYPTHLSVFFSVLSASPLCLIQYTLDELVMTTSVFVVYTSPHS